MSKIGEKKNNIQNKNNKNSLIIPQNLRCLMCRKKMKIKDTTFKIFEEKKKKNIQKEGNKEDNKDDKKENKIDNEINANNNNTNNIEENCENKSIENDKETEKEKENDKEKENPNFINILCNACNDKEAEFECLNCDLILCIKCKSEHQADPKFQSHTIKVYELNPNITFSQCPYHKLIYKFFCLDDNTPLCQKCGESLHQKHKIRLITDINDYYIENIDKEINKGKKNVSKLESLIKDLKNLKFKLDKEKEAILKKLEKAFNDINKIILKQKDIINSQINNFFIKKSETIEKKISTFNLILQRFDYYKNYLMVNKIIFFDSIKDKLNKIQLYKNLRHMNLFIFNKINYDYFYRQIKITSYLENSLFINNPIKKLYFLLNKYNFIPLPINILEHYKKLFKYSNIISYELITTDLILVLPKITSCKLLYRVSHLGPSAELFHNLCDNKGPTLMLVKTATGHIFGAFNSLSFKSVSKYELSNENFLFSITDGRLRRPMRCKLVKQLAEYALKQSNELYSPGFGISNDHDLFIAFRRLNNSYSHLGKVYKCPKGYEPKNFLAGKENQWDILDVEVFAINYISDDDFFNLCT